MFDPTALSARRIQKATDPNSQINSSLQHSQRVAVRKKVVTYRRECDHHNAVLVPFLLTTVGGFTPRTPNYDGGGIFDPKDAINALFPRGTVPMRGSLGTSIVPPSGSPPAAKNGCSTN